MGSKYPHQWFLKNGEERLGPFSTEEILTLHEKNEVAANQLLSTEAIEGQWISVEQLVTALNTDPTVNTFQAPPRPEDIGADQNSFQPAAAGR